MNNLLSDNPNTRAEEFIEVLAEKSTVRIERIVSRGHATPDGEWFDQESSEFVVLLKGAARLEYDDGGVQNLEPGDWLVIPPHRRHRVDWTLENTETVWLAVHYT